LHRRQIFDWKHHALVLISYVKNLRNRRSLLVPLRGFTLAEVLITLGIIGVVAALAIPTLISNNNKRIVETRLAKFYSTMNQAVELSEVENGPKEKWDASSSFEHPCDWVDKYLKDYIKTTEIKPDEEVCVVAYPDGSLLSTSDARHFDFYPKAQNYENKENAQNGKDLFTFRFVPQESLSHNRWHYKKGFEPYKYAWTGTENDLRDGSVAGYGCNNTGGNKIYCTAYIQYNNWKIPDDYPFKF
ncbi:type II secretion system protein, partial [bacterium]|nr:type II secretion system protein [bacterium]